MRQRKMTNEKIKSLTKLVQDLKAKQASPVPPKHANRVESYKAFLSREIRLAQAKLDSEKGV